MQQLFGRVAQAGAACVAATPPELSCESLTITCLQSPKECLVGSQARPAIFGDHSRFPSIEFLTVRGWLDQR
jgi:hypothetical protein